MSKHKRPVHHYQKLRLHITGQSHSGDGVGKVDGFTVFVPGGVQGETLLVEVTKVKSTYAHARIVKILEESPNRVTPPCPIFDRCGGCQLQHLSYEAQLNLKTTLVRDNLERIGKLKDVTVHPTLGMDVPWRYRNKAQVPFGEREGGLVAGFYELGTHDIIDMEACLIQHEESDEVVRKVKDLARELGIPPYREEEHQGVLRHVVTRVGANTDQLMIVLVTNGPHLPNKKELVKQLNEHFPRLKSVVQNINSERTNVIMGKESRTLWGEDTITDTIGDIVFVISPRSFYQVNPKQTEMLYEEALRAADLTGSETVIDAYCGIGTISLFLAQHAHHVLGVEIVDEAIADAKRNARLNGMDNVTFAVGKAEDIMPWWYAQGVRPDVIVVDPPRKGCDERLLDTIVKMQPDRVVYVSCNPSTLARDLRYLADRGFAVKEVQPVDMFPQTSHVECVSQIVLKND
mgnify:CR=1 FL=1